MIKESKEDHDLLSAVGQMSLCFAEVVILAILSIISKYIGEDIFLFDIFIINNIYCCNKFSNNKRREGLNYFFI